MDDEAGPQEAQAGPPASVGKDKPKRKPRMPTGPNAGLEVFPTTKAGGKVSDHLQEKLIDMLFAGARIEANRRRGTAIDSTDYEAAFSRIVAPSRRNTVVGVVADVAGFAGSCLIGFAINIYTSSPSTPSFGHLAMSCGVGLFTVSVTLKYAPPIR